MSKTIIMGSEAHDNLLKGLIAAVEPVAATMGPKGRNVIIESSFGAPKITKDGVTVAKNISLEDKGQNIVAQALKEAASQSNDKAGDGTTSTVVLAKAIIQAGIRQVAAGANPMDLKRGIEAASKAISKEIEQMSKKISSSEEIAQVATISANGDSDIGKKLAEAFKKVGNDGVVTVEEASKSEEFDVQVVEGMNLDRGFLSPYFISNPEKVTCELDSPCILVFDKKISSTQQILGILQEINQQSKPLLIIAEDVEGEALSTLILNRLRGTLKVAAIKAPGFGDRRKSMLEDIAILTGGKFISEEIGYKLENVTISDLGTARRVVITKDETTIIDGKGNVSDIQGRCTQLKALIADTTSEYDKEKLQERLAKLSGGIALLKVGGMTEVEVKEKKDRVEDAYHATKAAIAEGIVPGGGCALLYASRVLDKVETKNEDEKSGVNIMRKALLAPIRQILENAGLDASLIIGQLLTENNRNKIYDAQNLGIVDAYKSGIVDPTKVVRTALHSATSISALLITTAALIYDQPQSKSGRAGAGGMHGGMDDMAMGGF